MEPANPYPRRGADLCSRPISVNLEELAARRKNLAVRGEPGARTGFLPTTVIGPRLGAPTRHNDTDTNGWPGPEPTWGRVKRTSFSRVPCVASARAAAEGSGVWEPRDGAA